VRVDPEALLERIAAGRIDNSDPCGCTGFSGGTVQLKGGITTPLTATRAVSMPLGSVLAACSRLPSMMAMKTKIPTQLPMMLFLSMFVVSFVRELRSATADDLVSKREMLLFARTNNSPAAAADVGLLHCGVRPLRRAALHYRARGSQSI
jgi:hypothetical protein